MEKRILNYRKFIDELLEKGEDRDWEELSKQHLVQISFFQHERLIHLLVTLAFGLFFMLAIILSEMTTSIFCLLLVLLFLVVLIAYVRHYYILENETQKMYIQYDRIQEHIHEKTQAPGPHWETSNPLRGESQPS